MPWLANVLQLLRETLELAQDLIDKVQLPHPCYHGNTLTTCSLSKECSWCTHSFCACLTKPLSCFNRPKAHFQTGLVYHCSSLLQFSLFHRLRFLKPSDCHRATLRRTVQELRTILHIYTIMSHSHTRMQYWKNEIVQCNITCASVVSCNLDVVFGGRTLRLSVWQTAVPWS